MATSTIPPALNRIMVGDVDGARWALWTNGFAAIARPNNDASPTDVVPGEAPSGIIRAALSARTVLVDRAAFLSLIGVACNECGDRRLAACQDCEGSGQVERECEYCRIATHSCECERCDGIRVAPCSNCVSAPSVPALRVVSARYDSGLVRIVAGALGDAPLSIGEMPQNSKTIPGMCLVMRSGDSIGLVMEWELNDRTKRPITVLEVSEAS